MNDTHHLTNNDIYLGRQPILDLNQRVVAYELLFRSGRANHAGVIDPMLATAQVISYAFGELGIGAALGRSGCFINVDREMLMSDILELLPRERVTLEIIEDVVFDERVIQRCRVLKQAGYSLALDDFVYAPVYEAVFDLIDVIKVDITRQSPEEVRALGERFRHSKITMLAEKVETEDEYRLCRDAGYTLYQGYYFARPDLLVGKRAQTSKLAVLRLMGLIIAEADTNELIEGIKLDPGLSYGLLRLVNSASIGLRVRIDTLEQAVMQLGRKQIGRWLQLLLYANKPGAEQPCPLRALATQRSTLLEQLARLHAPTDPELADRAYLIGMLSLLDALLDMPMPEVIEQLSLSDELRRALLEHEGELGQLLALAKMSETGDYDNAATLDALGLEPAELADALVKAIDFSEQTATVNA